MSILIRKNWRDIKPSLGSQINFNHPLSQGLVGAWLMNEGGGRKIVDIVSNKSEIESFGATWSKSQKGSTLDFYNQYIRISNNPFWIKDNKITVSCIARVNSAIAGTDGYVIAKRDGVNGAGKWFIYANTIPDWLWYGNINIISFGSITYGKWEHLVGIGYGNSTGATFRNGKFVASGAFTNVVSTSDDLTFGARGDGAGGLAIPSDCEILSVQIWNRALSSSEISSLYEAPYQFIQPLTRRIFSVAEAPVVSGVSTGMMTTRSNFWGDI
jgi:hypothetical protein